MTQRAGEWHLVGYDSDPVPATDWDVRTIRDEMRQRARDASEMRDVLRGLADLDGWRGETANAFADKAEEVIGDLGKVEDRYDKAAQALTTWAGDVDTARDATWRALQNAEAADEQIRANPPHTGSGDAPDGQAMHDGRREDAEADLATARAAMRDALDAFEEAAERAKNQLGEAADVWDDGWWGNFKGWVRDNADTIAAIVQVLEIVAFVLGAIILVVAIVASAPFALIAAAVLVGLAVVAGKALLAAADTGKADWNDVAWAAVGVAATLVGGKLFTMAAKGLKGLMPAMSARVGAQAANTALRQLSNGRVTQALNAMKINNPGNNLFRWAQAIDNEALATGRAMSQAVDDIATVAPSRLSSILMQNRDLARLQAQLNGLRTFSPTNLELMQLSRIQLEIWTGIGANSVGTFSFGKGLADGSTVDLFTNPPWSTQPVN